MLAQLRAPAFRLRVELWSRLTGRGPFEWGAFEAQLEKAEFRSFGGILTALQSLGWAGQGSQGQWLFGVAGYWLPLYGKSVMRHELFHAAQDFKTGLFRRKPGILGSPVVEYSAHLWGGPLIGIPFAWVLTVLIVLGVPCLVCL